MRKIAIFVEGQTELIFTRELLLKCYEWQDIWIECYSLFNDRDLNPTDYSYKDPSAKFYYQILNIGNDVKVLPSILKREKYLFSANQSFDKIVGLRDMYSKDYREANKANTIAEEINQKFIDMHLDTIKNRANSPKNIEFHFAIMELETWVLAIENVFLKISDTLTNEMIETKLNINLQNIDPEKQVFHPASLLDEIMKLIGNSYDKKKGEVNKFMGIISKENFNILYESDKCEHFNHFCDSIEVNTAPISQTE
ncbi:hypothetical protein [Bernardetia sp. MNP-M8]|uniref:hypothetical protein n=1 Tax=Bernardetia sp. MNP-M8 TaxID=3127470 RepID=UPI0030D35EE1